MADRSVKIVHAKYADAERTICGLTGGPLLAGRRLAPDWRACKRCGKGGIIKVWVDEDGRTVADGGGMGQGDLAVGRRLRCRISDGRTIEPDDNEAQWQVRLHAWEVVRLPDADPEPEESIAANG